MSVAVVCADDGSCLCATDLDAAGVAVSGICLLLEGGSPCILPMDCAQILVEKMLSVLSRPPEVLISSWRILCHSDQVVMHAPQLRDECVPRVRSLGISATES